MGALLDDDDERGYVVAFVCLFVCLSVGGITQKSGGRMLMNLSEGWQGWQDSASGLNRPGRNRFLPVFATEIYIKILVMLFLEIYIGINITVSQILRTNK